MPSGFFISLEGGEGAGKSTQAALLVRRLGEAQIPTTLVREPGTTVLGTYLRDYLKSSRPISKEAELLLFEAARTQLVSDVIGPSLTKGITVVADRFEASSVAYQGHGRNIPIDVVISLNDFAVQETLPDLTFLLDIDPVEGLKRTGGQLALDINPLDMTPEAVLRLTGILQLRLEMEFGEDIPDPRLDEEGARRFEEQPLAFHTRVRDGFLQLAQDNPERWVVLDARRSADELREEIWRHVYERLLLPQEELRGRDKAVTPVSRRRSAANTPQTKQPLL